MVKKEISLVKAYMKDWQKILEFEKASKSKLYSNFETEKEIKKYLEKSRIYFVKFGKQIIGTTSYKTDNNSACIDGLIISPEQRGKGYAKIVIHLILEKIKNYKKAYLMVHPQNSTAIIIYLKEGFKITKWKNNYFDDNEPRLLLEKELLE
ncbi:MAG: GNAT family N-acetyltransferase [Candidatus Diapherotrites archaeon]|nr:GNAT family N-acetyltransferase [Candidatus Diapherotrites archaeon]